MFDEKTGEPYPLKGRREGFERRIGKTPCETSIGCAKGHWKDKPDLTPSQQAVITMYRAVRATGGKCLTKAESRDWFLTAVFAELYNITDQHARSSQAMTFQTMLAAMEFRK